MVVFTDVANLKEALLARDPTDFFEEFVLTPETSHFDTHKLGFVSEVLEAQYGFSPSIAELVVVGSSKIGFALHNKMKGGLVIAPAFRKFGDESDIDLSICSPRLFDLLWHELSAYLCKQKVIPQRCDKLGDYMTYGWLRQDQLPKVQAPHLIKCNNLYNVRGKIRMDRKRGHPKIDLGIFHDLQHLKLYQSRSISASRQNLEYPL